MRALLAAALLLTGCAPSMVVPAEGTRLGYEFCGSASGARASIGPAVYAYLAPCPDLARISERADRVLASDPLCELGNVRIFVVNAYVMCNEEPVRGCALGDLVTVTSDVTLIPVVEHELRHVCYAQRGDALGSFDLDHPEAEFGHETIFPTLFPK